MALKSLTFSPRQASFLALLLLGAVTVPMHAQVSPPAARPVTDRDLREQRDELERVRRERESLEREAAVLRNTAHELGDEVANLDRRVEASARIVKSLDRQLFLIADRVTTASTVMASAEQELLLKQATLERRVTDVYKRGPMFGIEAMLSAHSFGELVARYKYLHDLTLRDRALVRRVEQLRDQVSGERDRLVTLQAQLTHSRADKASEEERLRELEREQASNLRVVQQQARRTDDRVARLKKSEADMANALAALEEARKRSEAAKPATARIASAIKTSDYGRLDWPVNGPLVYPYGKSRASGGGVIHWNGVGIGAPAGTPVKSVGQGKVIIVRPIGTYGLTVFVDHGAGDYTIYGSLKRATVKEGQSVAKGDVIGETGVSDPELPAHLHFEIRTHGRDAIDPVKWLRAKR